MPSDIKIPRQGIDCIIRPAGGALGGVLMNTRLSLFVLQIMCQNRYFLYTFVVPQDIRRQGTEFLNIGRASYGKTKKWDGK